jgi:hypothetical protein
MRTLVEKRPGPSAVHKLQSLPRWSHAAMPPAKSEGLRIPPSTASQSSLLQSGVRGGMHLFDGFGFGTAEWLTARAGRLGQGAGCGGATRPKGSLAAAARLSLRLSRRIRRLKGALACDPLGFV